MDLSIIIVNYNTKKLILDCIASIQKEASDLKIEIIVIDNASTDGSIEELSFFEKKKILKLVKNDINLGFAKANNQGIKFAKGKYILLLNSDTVVKRGVFKKLLDFAKEHPDAGAVVPQLLDPNGTIQASCFNFPTITRAIRQYWLGQKEILNKYIPVTYNFQPITVEIAVMAAFLITPKTLKKVGPLDERYFMFFEDFEYCRQMKKVDLKLYYLPSVQVIHYHGGSGKNLVNESDQWRRLIPSSKIYHGIVGHYLFNFILWSGQRFKKLTSLK